MRGRKKKLLPALEKRTKQPKIMYAIESKLALCPPATGIDQIDFDNALKSGGFAYHPRECPPDRQLILNTVFSPIPRRHTCYLDWARVISTYYDTDPRSQLQEMHWTVQCHVIATIVRKAGWDKSFRPVPVKRENRAFLETQAEFWIAVIRCLESFAQEQDEAPHPGQLFTQLFLEGFLCPLTGTELENKTLFLAHFRKQNANLRSGANPFFYNAAPSAHRFVEIAREAARIRCPRYFHEDFYLPMVERREAVASVLDDQCFSFGETPSGNIVKKRQGRRSSKKVENITLA